MTLQEDLAQQYGKYSQMLHDLIVLIAGYGPRNGLAVDCGDPDMLLFQFRTEVHGCPYKYERPLYRKEMAVITDIQQAAEQFVFAAMSAFEVLLSRMEL